MAKSSSRKNGIEFAGFDKVLSKLNALNADTKSIADEALKKTFEIVTEKAEIGMLPQNLPAGGKYSTDETERSLRKDAQIKWSGSEGSVEVGFDISKGGLASIFLMYGTPRMVKDQTLYDAFFSEQTEGEILNAQKQIFYKALGELEG